MAINPSALFVGRITAPDANYPLGSSKDETSPGAGDGTPYVKARADDLFGFQQADDISPRYFVIYAYDH